MVSFGEKDKIKKAGNLNQGGSYVITTVHMVANLHLRQDFLTKYVCFIGEKN